MRIAVLSTMALQGAMQALAPELETSGVQWEAGFSPTLRLIERIRAGERADVAILTAAELGGDSVFPAGTFIGAPNAGHGRQPIAALSDPSRAMLYQQCGLEPVRSI